MQYSLNGVLISKKPHACGGNSWLITRTGADIKLKCLTCGRTIFVSIEQADKMKKDYKGPSEQNNEQWTWWFYPNKTTKRIKGW